MALVNTEKANENLDKFTTNIRKTALLTKDVSNGLIGINSSFNEMYRDIPDLIDIGVMTIESLSLKDRIDMLLTFVKKSLGTINGVSLWEKIKSKDAEFLSTNLSMIVPGNKYIDKIQYAYGQNPDGQIYVHEKQLKAMWLLVHALIHNSFKYVILSGESELSDTLMSRNAIEFWGLDLSK